MRLSTVVEAVEKPTPPPCKCGPFCPKVGVTLHANDNKLAGTEFLWFGIVGVGAVAFSRRRRDKENKNSD